LFIVILRLPLGIGPIAVGNKYIYACTFVTHSSFTARVVNKLVLARCTTRIEKQDILMYNILAGIPPTNRNSSKSGGVSEKVLKQAMNKK
jgi:hypothetical protein